MVKWILIKVSPDPGIIIVVYVQIVHPLLIAASCQSSNYKSISFTFGVSNTTEGTSTLLSLALIG
jgi:hypothetical protein